MEYTVNGNYKQVNMQLYNLHTHTTFSDGKAKARDFVMESIRQRFFSLGFSEHSPLPFENNFSIPEKDMGDYCLEIHGLREEFKNSLEIFCALEFDYIPGISKPFYVYMDEYRLDYSIGSVHLVANEENDKLWFIDGPKVETYDKGLYSIFNGNIMKAVESYFHQICMMIEEEKPDVIGHLDKIKMHNQSRYFSEDEEWYRNLITKTLNLIADGGLIMEVNTRGIYKKRCDSLFPGIRVLAEALQKGIPITLTSDAHEPEEISSYFPEALQILYTMGFRKLKAFGKQGWYDVEIGDLRFRD